MRRLVLISLCAAVVLVVAACGDSGPKAVPADGVAVVGNETITKDQWDALIAQTKRNFIATKRAFPKAGTVDLANLKTNATQFLIQSSEYQQEAEKLGVKVDDKDIEARLDQIKKQYYGNPAGQKQATPKQMEQRYRAALKQQGFTDEEVRQGIKLQLIREDVFKKVTKDVKVPDDEIKAYYDKNKQQYATPAQPESRDVRHILVKSHAAALTVYSKLKAGGDFSKLALKYSIDPSKTTGGRLTVCKEKTVSCPLKTVAPFEKAAFSLKTNEISKPVHTQFGWHVIQAVGPVNPPRKATTIPFDQVKAAIKQQQLQQKKQDTFTKWWNDTKKDFAKKTKYQVGYEPPASATQTTTTG